MSLISSVSSLSSKRVHFVVSTFMAVLAICIIVSDALKLSNQLRSEMGGFIPNGTPTDSLIPHEYSNINGYSNSLEPYRGAYRSKRMIRNRFPLAAPTMEMSTGRKSKEIIFGDKCRNFLIDGIRTVSDAVKVTLGPKGRNVLLEKEYGSPMIVNDGVTIARNIELKDRRCNAGAKLVQEVAKTSDDRAGDGTTSTAILTSEMVTNGIRCVNDGHNPVPIAKGIQKTSKILMEKVKSLARPVDGYSVLLNVATVATSGNAVMGEVIATAFNKLGSNAATILEDNPALEDSLKFTDGYTFERGWASPYFSYGESADSIEWDNPRILVCDHKIDTSQSMLQILEEFVRSKEPLVIIAEDFGQEALQTLIFNKMRGMLKVVAVKAPSFGERRKDYLSDIAVATGSTLISKNAGMSLEDITMDMLGKGTTAVIRKDRTSIITNTKDEVKTRINQLTTELNTATSKYDQEKLRERIAALSGGVARILIGAATETEQKEKRLRYEDAINAVRAALETGYVPGGGVTYLHMAEESTANSVLGEIEASAKKESEGFNNLNSEIVSKSSTGTPLDNDIELQLLGARIVLNSMKSITWQIVKNAGYDPDEVIRRITQPGTPYGYGWDARSNSFGDMITRGVIDPAKVIVSAIENSSAVAGLVLTTEGMMVEEEEKEQQSASPAMVSV